MAPTRSNTDGESQKDWKRWHCTRATDTCRNGERTESKEERALPNPRKQTKDENAEKYV